MNNKEVDAIKQNQVHPQILPNFQEEYLQEKITQEEVGFQINPLTIGISYKKYWFKINFTIELTKNKNIKYIQDGEVLRIEGQIQMKDQKIKKNIHFIKNLFQVGNTNEKKKKIGYGLLIMVQIQKMQEDITIRLDKKLENGLNYVTISTSFKKYLVFCLSENIIMEKDFQNGQLKKKMKLLVEAFILKIN